MKLGRTLRFVLVCPSIGLSTAAVYAAVTVPEVAQSGDAIRHAVQEGDIEEMGRRLHNALQPAAEKLCPELAALRTRLQALKPAGLLMSGSGTCLFALCHDRGQAYRLAHQIRHGAEGGPRPHVFVVRSCL